jgi:hypothetical protein
MSETLLIQGLILASAMILMVGCPLVCEVIRERRRRRKRGTKVDVVVL